LTQEKRIKMQQIEAKNRNRKSKKKKIIVTLALSLIFTMLFGITAYAVNIYPLEMFGIEGETEQMATTVQILLILTVLSLAPSILVMMTSFTRIVVVFSFLRNALGTQQSPPNQVMIGLALFLTLFIMTPVINDVKTNAYDPYMASEITQQEAFDAAKKPIREFMLRQTYAKDLNLFLEISGQDAPETYDELGFEVIIPSFIISELKRAFQIGFFIYIPFIIIDMVVASTLMSMGMMMMPPTMIALPFKLLMFVLVDGWELVIKTLITSFG